MSIHTVHRNTHPALLKDARRFSSMRSRDRYGGAEDFAVCRVCLRGKVSRSLSIIHAIMPAPSVLCCDVLIKAHHALNALSVGVPRPPATYKSCTTATASHRHGRLLRRQRNSFATTAAPYCTIRSYKQPAWTADMIAAVEPPKRSTMMPVERYPFLAGFSNSCMS